MQSAFPTGNGLVVVRDNEILLDRDLRDSTGDRWYWHIRLSSTNDTELRIRTARPLLVGQFGPAVLADGDYEWLWSEAGPDTGFDLQVRAGVAVHASATIPYGMSDLQAFRRRLCDSVWWSALTTSEGGWEVPMMRVGAPDTKCVILLTSRHHACEAAASFVLEVRSRAS